MTQGTAGSRRERGFTLIELLVVLVVVGMLVSLATFSPGSQQQRELENEARKLMATLEIASEESVLQNQELGFFLKDNQYDLRVLDEEKGTWTASKRGSFAPQSLPSWLQVDLEREGKQSSIFGPEEDDEEDRPSVVILSSGEITPFTLTLRMPDDDQLKYVIRSDGIHALKLETPNDEQP